MESKLATEIRITSVEMLLEVIGSLNDLLAKGVVVELPGDESISGLKSAPEIPGSICVEFQELATKYYFRLSAELADGRGGASFERIPAPGKYWSSNSGPKRG